MSFLEGVYYPRLFYVKSCSNEVYDWSLQMVNPDSHNWISFDDMKKLMKKEYGVEVKETKRDEVFTIYK